MWALYYVIALTSIAVLSPFIVGTKPIVCRYKGKLYFPALRYYVRSWQDPTIFRTEDRFRDVYPKNLKEKDPDSWAIWPLKYQDPLRPVRAGEWGDFEFEVWSGSPESDVRDAAGDFPFVRSETIPLPKHRVALKVADISEVDEIRDRLDASGLTVVGQPESTADSEIFALSVWGDEPTIRKQLRGANIQDISVSQDSQTYCVFQLSTAREPRRLTNKLNRAGVEVINTHFAHNPTQADGAPSSRNWFGTTKAGFDVFAIMVHSTRTALLVGFVSMGIASVIGITLGAFAGFFRGWVDIVVSRFIEVVMCVPRLVLILTLLAMVEKPTIWHIMAVLGFRNWTDIARLARAEFFKLRESDFVTAAKALGVGRMRIMFQHILRNAMAPVLVPITFGIAAAILTESALSFLGLVSTTPNLSWGDLLSKGRTNIENMWWLALFPGVAIFLTVLAYNLIGEGLQEATDPRLRDTD
jgi:peptide/nickel transport system permease protein